MVTISIAPPPSLFVAFSPDNQGDHSLRNFISFSEINLPVHAGGVARSNGRYLCRSQLGVGMGRASRSGFGIALIEVTPLLPTVFSVVAA